MTKDNLGIFDALAILDENDKPIFFIFKKKSLPHLLELIHCLRAIRNHYS